MKALKKIPTFKNDKEEAEFWETHSAADYIDWSEAEETVFPNLKPSTQPIRDEASYEREKKEDIHRWEQYLLTGKAVDSELVMAWLKDLSNSKDTPHPK